jgi:23S rRNA (adenine2503-C2)-methyltransferase
MDHPTLNSDPPSHRPSPGPALDIDTWCQRWRALGANERHLQHLLRTWVRALPLSRPRRQAENFLPAAVRDDWPQAEQQLATLAGLHSAHPAEDGAQRLLVRLHDGQAVESVLLPRGGLCVSTQVGCAVGCVFCMTGQGGLLRQMGSAEIVAQVALARQRRAVNKVVFMGMGEPAHNLEAVMAAIELLGTAGGIAHKNLVFSTVGDARAFERLPQGRVKPALALSLHTADDALRATLLPRAPRIAVTELVAEADRYARATGYPVQMQWALMEGVNDRDEDVEAIAGLLKGRHAMMNLIPLNAVPGIPWKRPAAERAAEMARSLNRRGVLTRLRQSAGQDVDGGCGQLRARLTPERSARSRVVRLVQAPEDA